MDEQQFSPPAGALNALLSNPELLGRIGAMLGSMQSPQSAPQGEQALPAPPPAPLPVAPTPMGNAGIGTLLADPTLMERLPAMLAAVKPLLGSIPVPPPDSKEPDDCRNRLLLALKPYLSPQRRQAIDAILRLTKLGEALKSLN